MIHVADLTLRPWQPEDLPALRHIAAESAHHLRPWMKWTPESFLHRALTGWTDGSAHNWAVTREDTILGNICLITEGTELAYWLHHAHTGQGIATRAARAVLRHHDRAPVTIRHHPDNTRSAALAHRIGFTRISTGPAETRWQLDQLW